MIPSRRRTFGGLALLLALTTPWAVAAPTTHPTRAPRSYDGPPGQRPPLKLDALAAVAYALGHTPSLLAQQAQVLSLDSTFTKLRAGQFPTAAGQLQNSIQKSSNLAASQFGLTPVSNFSQNSAQLQSTYNLYNGTQQITAEQAKKQVANAKYELTRQQEQLAVTVSNGFYGLAARHGAVVLDENDLKYQQALLDSARAEERVGRVAGVDVLRAQVAVARSTSTLVQARTDEENARESLAVSIGAPTDTQFDLPGVLPEPAAPATAPDVLGAIARSNRPEIAEARAQLDVAKLGDAAVDSDLRPTVQLTGAFGSQIAPTNFVFQQQQIDLSNAAALANYEQEKALFPGVNFPAPVPLPAVNRRQPGFWEIGIVSTFLVPLYDYGTRAAAHHAARAQIDSSLASLYNAYDSVQADLNASVRNLESATEKLRLAKLSSEAATESARIAQLQYKNGLISFTDATQTQQTALSAQNDLIAARVTYVTSLIKLRAALAPPDPAAAADLRGL